MMMTRRSKLQSRPGDKQRRGHVLVQIAGVGLLTAICLTWVWSTLAVDVLGVSKAGFVNFFAIVLSLYLLSYGAGLAFRLGRRRP